MLVGAFTTIGGQTRNHIAALDTGTGLATTWDPNADSNVNSMVLSGTTLYTAGAFTTIGGQTRNYIAALDTGTGLATTWDPNADYDISSIVLSNGLLYTAGYFDNIGGQVRHNIAALDTGTGLATTWDPNANNRIYSIQLLGTNLYLGGNFTTISGVSRNRLASVDINTGLTTDWNPVMSGTVSSISISDTQIITGGAFQDYFAAFDLPVSPSPTASPTPTDSPSSTSTPSLSTFNSPNYVCHDSKPISVPNLFQINTTAATATLYFSPIQNNNKFYISYSTNKIAEEHGIEVELSDKGVQSYTIKDLKANKTYYFKVRGQNGCMPRDWSNIRKTTTRNKSVTRKIITNSVAVGPTPKSFKSTTPSPVVKTEPAVSKKCYFWGVLCL